MVDRTFVVLMMGCVSYYQIFTSTTLICFSAVLEEWELNTWCCKGFCLSRLFLVCDVFVIDTPLVLIRIVINALLWNLEKLSDVEATVYSLSAGDQMNSFATMRKHLTSTLPDAVNLNSQWFIVNLTAWYNQLRCACSMQLLQVQHFPQLWS